LSSGFRPDRSAAVARALSCPVAQWSPYPIPLDGAYLCSAWQRPICSARGVEGAVGRQEPIRASLALLDEAAKLFVPGGKNDVPRDLDGFEQAAVVRHEEKGAAVRAQCVFELLDRR
jgi:hypothetical protein